LFWIIAVDYEQARPEFQYCAEWLTELGAIENPKRSISMPKVGRCMLRTKTGQVIETRSADDVKKIAGRAPDGIILAEAAQMGFEAYLKSIGRLSERRGWLLLSGTFESSSGWYVDLFNDWQSANPEGARSFSVPTWSNLKVYPGGRRDPEILRMEAMYSKIPGMFEERCGAVPMPPSDLVFRTFREPIHMSDHVRFEKSKPVYLAIDPSGGTNPYAVCAVQFYSHEEKMFDPPEVYDKIDFAYVIDVVYKRGKIDEQMIDLAKERPWWRNVAGGAIDVEAPDSKKRWLKYGGVSLWSKKIPVNEGIRRMHTFLHCIRSDDGTWKWPPHLLLNPSCEDISYEFRNFKRAKSTGGVRQGLEFEFKEKPPPNQPDHALKALWYLFIARYGYVKAIKRHGVAKTWTNPLRRRKASTQLPKPGTRSVKSMPSRSRRGSKAKRLLSV